VPRVSVIVAAYQAEAHLGAALASVAGQSYSDWEVVVADDGSSDRTAEVARAAGATVVRSEINRGLAAARNHALDHATGELVALLDSDDEWLPTYLEEQVALFDREQRRGGDVGIVCCDARLAHDGHLLEETFGDRIGRPRPPVTAGDLVRANVIFVSALCPRSVVDAAGGFDPQLRAVEDLDLWLRIVEAGGRVVYNPAALVIYRLSPAGLSTDAAAMARAHRQVLAKALARGSLPPAARRRAQLGVTRGWLAERVASRRRR